MLHVEYTPPVFAALDRGSCFASDPCVAYARDLSKGGMAFIATAPVTLEGKIITLPRRNAPPLRVRATPRGRRPTTA